MQTPPHLNLLGILPGINEYYNHGENLKPFKLSPKQNVTPFFRRLILLFEKNHSNDDFNVRMVSDKLCLCPMQLYRKVLKQTGLPPGQLLLRFRIVKAMELLFNSELNITEISYHTGFGSHAHFSKAFKRVVGHAPNEIRKRFLADVIKKQKKVINE